MSAPSNREAVTHAARELGLLDKAGNLVDLDSIMIIDLVVALEEGAGLQIPIDSLRAEAFQSIDTVVQLLTELRGNVEPHGH